MPAGRPPSHTHGEFVAAAIRLADESGLSALTMKALGDAIGASTTAVYRYFSDKDELVAAMRDALLAPVALGLADAGDDARARIEAAALAFRNAVKSHPCLGQLMALPASDLGASALLPGVILNELERMGLRGHALVLAYQQLESFVIGSTAFDYADAPRHLEDRLVRFRNVGHPALEAETTDAAAVDRMNDEAFATTLGLLLDAIAAGASGP